MEKRSIISAESSNANADILDTSMVESNNTNKKESDTEKTLRLMKEHNQKREMEKKKADEILR